MSEPNPFGTGGTSIGSIGHPSVDLGTPRLDFKGTINMTTDSSSPDSSSPAAPSLDEPSLDPSSSKPGRPSYDVSDQVFAYVSSKETEARSLTHACRDGLVVCDGRGKIVRQMKGNHLKAEFRPSERDRIVPWERPTTGYAHAWPTFMGRPLPKPLGAATPQARKAGRKRNIRSR